MADVLAGRAWTVLDGDVRARLADLEPESVHCAITSPPYWGLRSYSTEPQIWSGAPDCAHVWCRESRVLQKGTISAKQSTHLGNNGAGFTVEGATCTRCGAWRGELGSEPTPELFIAHLVDVFRAVHRVLRNDGTCWVNLGSSYAGSGRGPTGHNGLGDQALRQGFNGKDGGEVRPVSAVAGGDEPFALRDDLTTEELAYVLTELGASFREHGEVGFPDLAVGVDP
jgi:DNA modification methylase